MNKSIVLKKHPKEYLKQDLHHCGACSVKGILSAYGKDNKKYPGDYHASIIKRILGYRTIGRSYWLNLLKSYGLNAKINTLSQLTDKSKLKVLTNLLDKKTPIMITVGNAYLPNGKFNHLLGSFLGHWITLWGYNKKEKVFYIYDSSIPTKLFNKDIPVGNVKRTYAELLRDINAGGLFSSPWKYFYIKIKN